MRFLLLFAFLCLLACHTPSSTHDKESFTEGFAFIKKQNGKSGNNIFSDDQNEKTPLSYQTAKKVFDQLVQARGDFQMRPPKFIMSDAERQVAIARPRKAEITLELKAYEVCRSMGKDSLNALAVLLSHELIHYYEKHDWTNHFARLHQKTNTAVQLKDLNEALKLETQADYLGGFLAYAAGYQPLAIMPELLDAIYESYGLTEEINGYPSLQDRKTIAAQSLQKLEGLVHIFETANYLTALEQYETAKHYLEFILKDFQSRELYNNLGVITTQIAMDYLKPKDIQFALPIELDGTSRLIRNLKGSNRPNTAGQELLREAIRYFEQASQLDRSYPITILNLACTYTLLQEYEDAMFYARKAQKLCIDKKWKKTETDILVLQGILAERQGDHPQAKKQFHQAIKSGSKLAELNLKILERQALNTEMVNTRGFAKKAIFEDFNLDKAVVQFLKGELSIDKLTSVNKRTNCGFMEKENSIIYAHLVDEDQYSFFQFSKTNDQHLTNSSPNLPDNYEAIIQEYGAPDRMIQLGNGSILVFYSEKILIRLDAENAVNSIGIFRSKN